MMSMFQTLCVQALIASRCIVAFSSDTLSPCGRDATSLGISSDCPPQDVSSSSLLQFRQIYDAIWHTRGEAPSIGANRQHASFAQTNEDWSKYWLLKEGDKPWLDDDMRLRIQKQSKIDGARVFGDNLKSRWLVLDDVLTERQCAGLRNLSDTLEREHWALNQEETQDIGKVGTSIQTHDQHSIMSDDILHSPKDCSKSYECKLFLYTRHLVTAATRTFFEESHMIHPELTTVQRRSRPPSQDSSTTVHQGAHADSCQIEFKGSTRRCGVDSNDGFTQRTHTAVLYLSDYSHAKGGELFMTDIPRYAPPMDERKTIPLKCGRLVVFESGPQNLHGVNSFESGDRYAMDLWFATTPGHFEAQGKGWTSLAQWEGFTS